MRVVTVNLMLKKNLAHTLVVIAPSFGLPICDVNCGSLSLVVESCDEYTPCHVSVTATVVAFILFGL